MTDIPVRCLPTDAQVRLLVDAHLALMRASSPACSVHAMDASSLEAAGADLLAIHRNREAVAIGALKAVDETHGEIKSMHVAAASRGQGLADAILAALLDLALSKGMVCVSLETGRQDVFAPARAFYRRHGFVETGPFGDYADDPASAYFTRLVSANG